MKKKLQTVFLLLCIVIFTLEKSEAVNCENIKKSLVELETLNKTVQLTKQDKYQEAININLNELNYAECFLNDPIAMDLLMGSIESVGNIFKERMNKTEEEYIEFFEKNIKKHFKPEFQVQAFIRLIQTYLQTTFKFFKYTPHIINFSQKEGVCIFKTDWGSAYYGCNRIQRVTDSSLLSINNMNELTLLQALINIGYFMNKADPFSKDCPKNIESDAPEALYGLGALVRTESFLIDNYSHAPKLISKLIDISLNFHTDFKKLASLCKEQK